MGRRSDTEAMTLFVIVLIVALGPLAVLYGADSRLDDRRR
jgi:hypothetical protein